MAIKRNIPFILFASLLTQLANANSVYLEPQYTIALAPATFINATLVSQNLTPLVFEDRILTSGKIWVIHCKNHQAKIIQIEKQLVNIPVQLGINNQQPLDCAKIKTTTGLIFWDERSYKLKQQQLTQIDDNQFEPVSFNIKTNDSLAKITQITSDNNLTNLIVNHAKYFTDYIFYGVINQQRYLLQVSNDQRKFTIHGANFQQILIVNPKDNTTIISVDFPKPLDYS